ncbi:hypothetical protein CLPU_22c00290 [Gottschalkia purinilytica]|uniref:Uncharacterized protein n=1 Tax=Gottschalkia purinilytica TaxID=1503 RepID=A0A0L0W6R4_GOTPU|nr:baseplate J/gp47 family protein [Gottschalkia purinilytica]KNF07177.1 hypothetical protein CLPU_22c00290 [Gottschalkia purinilytica]
MFENQTEEAIKQRILDRIDNSMSKIEGTLTHDAISPTSIELAQTYINLDYIANKLDIDSLEGAELEQRIKERTGIERKPATKATTNVVIHGSVGAEIRKGDIVGSNSVNFISLENKTIGEEGYTNVNIECERFGTVGNVPTGAINFFPISIPGLSSVNNPDPVTNGYDAESDKSLLERYYAKVRTPATSGNRHHYANWAKEVIGVGEVKIIPLWNGNGTVKIVIVNQNKMVADDELIQRVFNYIEDVRPIGATITVTSATPQSIDIDSIVTLSQGYQLNDVLNKFKEKVESYRKDVALKDNYISYAAIGNILFNIEGVLDYKDLKLNNKMESIVLGEEEVPIINSVNLAVM